MLFERDDERISCFCLSERACNLTFFLSERERRTHARTHAHRERDATFLAFSRVLALKGATSQVRTVTLTCVWPSENQPRDQKVTELNRTFTAKKTETDLSGETRPDKIEQSTVST